MPIANRLESMKEIVLTESKDSNLIRFVMGVETIRRYEPNAEMSVSNGFIYVGDYEASHSKMMEIEKAKMKALGWIEGDESWAFYA